MSLEFAHDDDLRSLTNALRSPGYRYIVVGHNRHSIYLDLAAWLRECFPERAFLELPFSGKDYSDIMAPLRAFGGGIVLIPDFDWLLREGNERIRVAFNQRRDYFTQRDFAFLCFVQPGNFPLIAKKLPDWWSGRSLELHFQRDVAENTLGFIQQQPESSSLGGETLQEKETELALLFRQLEVADRENKGLLFNLHDQISSIFYRLARWEEALKHLETMLILSQEINDHRGEGATLNNISLIYKAKGDYDMALQYLEQSLKICQVIGDRAGEGTTLNNISQIHSDKGDYETALQYLEQSLKIQQTIGGRTGEGATLNNLGQIHSAKGDYDTALRYLEQSSKISQDIGDRAGEGTTLNNISLIHSAKGDYDTALQYLEQSLRIAQAIGDIPGMATTLANIGVVLLEQNRREEAILPLLQAHQIFEKIGSPNVQESTKYLNLIYQQIGEKRFKELSAGI